MNRTHLDLFSGIGGFALACRWAGVETIGFAEIDDYASRVLAKNFPGVPNYGDVRNVPGSAAAWLVTGGFPCQPFSYSGEQRGTDDDRYLWPEMAEIVKHVRPTWLLAENVLGIVNMGIDQIFDDLAHIGYSATALVIPALAVDARHRRDRVWIVGHSSGSGFGRLDWWRTGAQSENGHSELVSLERFAEWPAESSLRRVAHGIPNRMDRIRGLGNAIVPQVAYQLIQMMIAAEDLG